MGANVLLVMPGTAASGGVSFGAGSVMTLTPRGLRGHSPGMPRRPERRPRRPRPHPGRLRQPQLGPTTHVRHHAGIPGRARTGATWPRERPFTDRDVLNGNKVCLLGQTLVRELFQGESPDRQGDPRQERLLPGGRRAEQQGRQHDGHGPGRHPPGALDHHQVPRHRLHAGQRQPERQQWCPAAR